MPFPQTSRQNFWGKKSESDVPLQTRPGSFVGEFARIVMFAIIIAILFLMMMMMMMISEQGGRWDFVRSVYLDEVSSANSPPSHQSAILILTITTSTSASLSILIRKTWSSPPEEKVGEMEVDSPSQGITFTSLILPFHHQHYQLHNQNDHPVSPLFPVDRHDWSESCEGCKTWTAFLRRAHFGTPPPKDDDECLRLQSVVTGIGLTLTQCSVKLGCGLCTGVC